MVTVKIDGRTVTDLKARTILDIAGGAGIYIPTLCSHAHLAPFGACRMCLVKVEGMRNVVPACTTPVTEGMVITTDDEEIRGLRKNILSLILSEHPSGCILCDDRELCFKYHREPQKAGACTGCKTCPNMEGCELYRVAEKMGIRDIGMEIEYKGIPVKRDDPFLDRDYNICILCGRCVRMCDELRGVGAIAFTYRSQKALIGTAFDKPLVDSGCIFCGACVDACPTGALSEKRTKWGGRAEGVAITTCMLCPAGCSLGVEVKWDRVQNARPTERGANQGQLCLLGRFCVPPMVNAGRRMEYPMVRRNGVPVPVSWEEAFAHAAGKLKAYRPEQIAFVVSPWMTNEAGYLLRKLARSVGTDNVILASRLAARVAVPLKMALGQAGPKGTVADIASADTILVVGADLGISAPVLLPPIFSAHKRGAKVAFIGKSGRVPRYADMHVEPADINSFLTEVLGRMDAGDAAAPAGARDAADLAGMVKRGRLAIVFGDGLSGPGGERTVALLCNILSRAGGGALIPVWDGGNVQGMLDIGAWGKDELGPEIKALYLTEPIERIPDGVETVILQDVYRSDLMKMAEAVFPAAAFTETGGTATSMERRVQKVARCASPPRMALEDWAIIAKLACALGERGFEYASVEDVTREMFEAVPGMAMGLRPGGILLNFISDIGKMPACGRLTICSGKKASYRGVPIREVVEDLDRVLGKWGVPR